MTKRTVGCSEEQGGMRHHFFATSSGETRVPYLGAMDVDHLFASTTVPQHIARGVLGLAALVAAFGLLPVVGPLSLLLVPIGALFLRGCPGCWAIGLIQTISRGRVAGACEAPRRH